MWVGLLRCVARTLPKQFNFRFLAFLEGSPRVEGITLGICGFFPAEIEHLAAFINLCIAKGAGHLHIVLLYRLFYELVKYPLEIKRCR